MNECVEFFDEPDNLFAASTLQKNSVIPFKDHPQFPHMLDVFRRKYKHHLLLQHQLSSYYYGPFISALLAYLREHPLSKTLNEVEIYYLKNKYTVSISHQIAFENELQKIASSLDKHEKLRLLVFKMNPFDTQQQSDGVNKQLKCLLEHPQCRCVILEKKNAPLDRLDLFTTLKLNAPTSDDMFHIFKLFKDELEKFHQTGIADEMLYEVYALATRYLSTQDCFEQALSLLDSSAALAAAEELTEHHYHFKTGVTMKHVLEALAHQTQIPAYYLQMEKMKPYEITQSLGEHVFGQENALTMISDILQKSCTQLRPKRGTFCNLLFVGPKRTGKKTAARALVRQLFHDERSLFYAQNKLHVESLLDIKVYGNDSAAPPCALKNVIEAIPYATIYFEDIEKFPENILDDLSELLTHGYLQDTSGKCHYFHQAIIIFATSLTTHYLQTFACAQGEEDRQTLDLLQLVMQEQTQAGLDHHDEHTMAEILQHLSTELKSYLPDTLCKQATCVPFFPLNMFALEKIVTQELKSLAKLLAGQKVELTYAAEVVRFLATDLYHKQQQDQSGMDGIQHLYHVIEQALLTQAEQHHRPTQLFLQLNETGQILRCDWLSMNTIRHI